MAFKFKLESVLSFTQSKEDKVRQEYGKVIAQLQRAEEHLEYLEIELKREYKFNKIDIALMVAKCNYQEKIKTQIEQQLKIIADLERKAEEIRKKMTEIFRERKTLEKLKEKHFEEYQKEQTYLEQKFLDEQALLGFQRQ